MPLHDLDQARALHAALVEFFAARAGGRDDAAALAHVSSMCEAVIVAVNDLECRVAIRGIESLARLLFSDEGHLAIDIGSMRGTKALRYQIFNALSAFRGRLEALERRVPSKPELPALSGHKGVRILVVEDNRDSAESLRKLLEVCGYAVTVAYSGGEGLEAAQRMRPDIVLCDIGLPDRDGFAIAAALRGNPTTSKARLIAVTAYGSDEDRQRSREAGFQLHLVKPVSPDTLLRQLDQKAEGKQAN